MTNRKTILFIGEAASLAHVVRPMVLAGSLDPEVYDIHFACDDRYSDLIRDRSQLHFWPIKGIASRAFTRAADRGGYVLSEREINAYLGEEFELFARIQPHLIINDLRLTITISAESAKIPYATLSNVHWSPYRNLGFNPVPEVVKQAKARRLLKKILPIRSKSLTANINKFRSAYGLPALKGYLELAVRGDYTLYPEPEGFIPTHPLPASHIFLGPVLWESEVPKPGWWQKWDPGLPVIYLTLGSTGQADRLPEIARRLAELRATVVVSTAGRINLEGLPQNVFAADYLPGMELCGLASVVVCNGGSATAYQALSQGKPVVCLWGNIDQYLTSQVIAGSGAGLACRADGHEPGEFKDLVSRVLLEKGFTVCADKVSELFRTHDACKRFAEFLGSIPELK